MVYKEAKPSDRANAVLSGGVADSRLAIQLVSYGNKQLFDCMQSNLVGVH